MSGPSNIKNDRSVLERGRVIVTYSRSLMSLVIARSLTEKSIDVVGCDDVEFTALSFSKHCSDHFVHPPIETDPEAAVAAIIEAVKRFRPEDGVPYVLIPGFRDAKFFAEHRDQLEPYIAVAAPELSSIEKVHPKHILVETAETFGWPTPHTDVICGENQLTDDGLDWPRIMKPTDGVGGRGVETLDGFEAAQKYLESSEGEGPYLLQEMVEGEDYCAAFCADKGKLTGLVVYRNLRQFPKNAGAGAVRETVDPAPFLETVQAIAADTKWNGVAQADFCWNGDAQTPPKLIEINPRFWAGLFHCVASGVDFPWILFQQTTGQTVADANTKDANVGFTSKTSGAWLLSLAQDTWDSIALTEEQGESLRRAIALIKDGDLRDAWDKCRSLLKEKSDGASVHQALTELWPLPSELGDDNDPAVPLGALFIASSLIRHGELPQEITHKEPSSAPTSGKSNESATDRPIIGITHSEKGEVLPVLAMKFAVWIAGGRPVSLTPKSKFEVARIDGLILGGGLDIHPSHYGSPTEKPGYHYDRHRDDMETRWMEKAERLDIPVLGVCRGMQMMNVVAEGTLWPDLRHVEERYPNRFLARVFFRKAIYVKSDTPLSEALGGTGTFQVNSIHSQAVQELGEGLDIWATERNGLIQGMGDPKKNFWLGVQFHPEYLIHHKFARNLFRALVEAGRSQASRQ